MLRRTLTALGFGFAKLRPLGRTMVAEVPESQLPSRTPDTIDTERMNKEVFYEWTNYKRGDRPPRCKYFSTERKGRVYHVFDAYNYPLGRLINKVSTAIRGRNSPLYRNDSANVKFGDICVIVNIQDPLLTGKKLLFKSLKYHTGFIGHLKQHSYKQILNTKPQLLYHFLLRKSFPKNKLSMKYLDNVILVRGPSHDIAHLPQFAPDQNKYQPLTHTDLLQYLRNDPDVRIMQQSHPNAAKEILKKEPQRFMTERDRKIEEMSRPENVADTEQMYEEEPKIKLVVAQNKRQAKALRTRENQIRSRHKRVGAPYRKKNQKEYGFEYFDNERKARNHPMYDMMAHEEEEDDEDTNDEPTNPYPNMKKLDE